MISLLLSVCVIGFVVYLILTLVPMAPPFPQILSGLAALICLMIILKYFGLFAGSPLN